MSSDCFHLTNGLRDWKGCGAITICFEWFALSNIALHLIINLFLSSPIKPCSIQLKHPSWWNLHVNDMIIWHPNVEICKIKTEKGYMSSEISQCTTVVGRCQGEATFWLIGASNPSLSFYNDIMGLECSLNFAVFLTNESIYWNSNISVAKSM